MQDNENQDPPGLEGLKTRFSRILDEHSQVWWANALNVSQSVLSGSWKAGKLPRVDNIYKVLEIKGISANWFFFKLGPKYLRDLDDAAIEKTRGRARKTQIKILEAEDEILRLQEKIGALERQIEQQKIFSLIPLGSPADADRASVFEQNGLPLLTFMRMMNEVLFKAFEIYLTSENPDEKMKNLMAWIINNFKACRYSTIASLTDLTNKI